VPVLRSGSPSQPRPNPPDPSPSSKGASSGSNTAKTGTSTITEPMQGPTIDSIRKWIDVQIPYKNLAGNQIVAERALEFVRQHKDHYELKHRNVTDRWETLLYLLRGHTMSRPTYSGTPVHVPELYKLLEAVVPRIVEAVLSYSPWFRVKGREQIDKLEAEQIRAYLEYQLYRDHFDDQIDLIARTMMVYSAAPLKVTWEQDVKRVVPREVEREVGDVIRYRVTRTAEEEKVIYEGNKIRLIDPKDFFIDPLSTDPQKAKFVGDTCSMTLDDLLLRERLGIFQNVSQLLEVQPQNDPQRTLLDQIRSSDIVDPNLTEANKTPGAPRSFDVTEMWCLFSPDDSGRTEEYVITIANNSVVLRVQKNPYDDKHRPYAVARAAREPFTFWNIGPLDNGIPLQIEFDEHRNFMRETHHMSLAPFVWVPPDSDMPDSIMESEPGRVWRSSSPPSFLQVKSTVGEGRFMEEILRRDLQEMLGVPPIFEGGQAPSTATATERQLQEGNKRIKSYARSLTICFEAMLRIMHANNAQYLTRRQTFEVLGRSAAGLRAYEEIGPELFNQEIDFEFVGIANMHTMGLRATNMQQWLTLSYPFAQQYPGQIDFLAALDMLFKEMVGTIPGEEIIKKRPSLDEMMSQDDENILLAQGRRVEIHQMDDDGEHLREMRPMMENIGDYPTESQRNILEHYQAHVTQRERKRIREAAAAKLTPSVAGPQQTIIDKERGTTGARGPGLGANGAPGSPAQTPMGETPGPENGQRVRAPDRGPSLFQGQNMMAMR
jgi:hypothetical protein